MNNFAFKSCLFGATNRVKNSNKNKYVYRGYRIVFDGAGSWSFGNDFVRDAVIFGLIIVHHLTPIIIRMPKYSYT